MYKELAIKYGLTEEQVKQLDNQYWMEYVIKTMLKAEHDRVILEYFGTFYPNIHYLKHLVKVHENKLKNCNPNTVWESNLKNIIEKEKRLIYLKENETIPINSKRHLKKTKINS